MYANRIHKHLHLHDLDCIRQSSRWNTKRSFVGKHAKDESGWKATCTAFHTAQTACIHIYGPTLHRRTACVGEQLYCTGVWHGSMSCTAPYRYK